MHHFRCVLAFMFAILIASPACCCFGSVPRAQQAEHTCCGGKKEKKESICSCAVAKTQKMADADINVPPVVASPAPPQVVPVIQNVPPRADIPAAAAVYAATGPPRLRLALLQRFLI